MLVVTQPKAFVFSSADHTVRGGLGRPLLSHSRAHRWTCVSLQSCGGRSVSEGLPVSGSTFRHGALLRAYLLSARNSQIVPFSTKDRPTRSIISPGWSLSNVVAYGWDDCTHGRIYCNALWWYVDERRCVILFSGGRLSIPLLSSGLRSVVRPGLFASRSRGFSPS